MHRAVCGVWCAMCAVCGVWCVVPKSLSQNIFLAVPPVSPFASPRERFCQLCPCDPLTHYLKTHGTGGLRCPIFRFAAGVQHAPHRPWESLANPWRNSERAAPNPHATCTKRTLKRLAQITRMRRIQMILDRNFTFALISLLIRSTLEHSRA